MKLANGVIQQGGGAESPLLHPSRVWRSEAFHSGKWELDNGLSLHLQWQYCGWLHLCGKLKVAALPNPFAMGTLEIWNRPQQKRAANLQLWVRVLMGTLGRSWVV